MITENERDYLIGSMCSLLDEYGYTYSYSALNGIIDEWCEQKEHLIEAFKKHPNYVPGKFMIALNADYNRIADPNVPHRFFDWIRDNCIIQMKDKIPENLHIGYGWNGYLHEGLYDLIVYDLRYRTAQYIEEELATRLNSFMTDLHARAGQKTSKVINKVMRLLGYDQHPDYNREFAKYADSLNPLVVTRRTVLSINPLDYLTMSFGNSWASCHTIDKSNKRGMPNDYSGCYSSGTISYMLDPSSMVFYTVDTSYTGDDYWTQDKINRQMFHWGENKLVQSRLYPQSNDCNGEAYTPYRNIVQDIMSTIFEFGNLWTVKKGTEYASKYIISGGTHYRDYGRFGSCTLSVVKGMENDNNIFVGADPICIECGDRHSNEEDINCCRENYVHCERCGEVIDLGYDDYVEIYGDYYHTYCVNYCDRCDNYTTSETEYIASEDRYVCERCLEYHYDYCEEHDGYEPDNEVTYVPSTNRHVCNDCLDEYYSRCNRCRQYYLDDEIEFDDDGASICRSCNDTASE